MNKEELKEYIDNHFLNKVSYRRKYDEQTDEEYYFGTIQISVIERSKIIEDDLPFVFDYLKTKNIYVSGNSSVLYGDFDNYISSNRHEAAIHLPKAISKGEFDTTIKKYEECSLEEEKKLLRNKLIEGNLRLVNKVIMNCYRYRELDQEELRSYGYEGLIRAIDNYSSDKGIFSTFAISYIDGYIKRGLGKIRNIKNVTFFSNYLNCKKSLETELGYQIKNNEEFDYLDDIIDIYMEVYASGNDTKENLKRRIYLSEFLPLDDDNLLVEDFSDKVIDDVFLGQVHEDIINSIEKLSFSSKLAIYHLYEVDSLKKREVDNIIKNRECDGDYIRKAKARAINSLKQEDCLRKDFEEFENKAKKKKQKTKRKTWNNVIYMV